jgi:hypothetical protein
MAFYCTQDVAKDGPLIGKILTVYGHRPAEFYYHELERGWLSWILRSPLVGVLYKMTETGWHVVNDKEGQP